MTSTDIADSSVSSDDSDEEVVTPYSTKELVAIVKKLEIDNAGYRHELRKFTSGTASSASSPAATVSGTSQHPLEDDAQEFTQLGRLFCALNEFWVRRNHLHKKYPEDLRELGPHHPGRYRNDRSKRDGVVAELYGFVPLHLHEHLEGSHLFADKFAAGAKSMRSYITSNIRSNAESIFPIDVKQGVYAVGFDRSGIPAIISLLRNPKKPTETYPTFCPVLYKDGVISGSKIFSGVSILNILKVILLGPSSITRAPGTSRPGPPPLATTAEIKSITPGLVAMAAIVARFILSNDLIFREVGGVSGVKYLDEFNLYKKFLTENFHSPGILATFAHLNWEVLGISSPTLGSTSDDQNEDQGEDEEMARMMAEVWVTDADSTVSAQSPEPAPATSSHDPSPPAPAEQPDTSPIPRSDEPTALTKKARSKATKKDKGGATGEDRAAPEPVRRGGRRKAGNGA